MLTRTTRQFALITFVSAACALGSTTSFAHQAYLAPLSHQVATDSVLLHAGATDHFFFAEHAIDAAFFAVNPEGQLSEITNTQKLTSVTVADAAIKETGSHYFFALAERNSSLAQKDGKWLPVRDISADKAPPAEQRKFLLKSEVQAGWPTVETKTINKLATFVNKSQASDAAKLSQAEGFELAFAQTPVNVSVKDAVSFTTRLNGKPVAGVEVKLIETDKPLDDATKHSYTSDAKGRVSITLPKVGGYLLTASTAPKTDGDKPAPITYQYALSFIAK